MVIQRMAKVLNALPEMVVGTCKSSNISEASGGAVELLRHSRL